MALALTLKTVSDEGLQAILDAGDTRGREAIYKAPIADMLAQSNGNNVTGSVEWNAINAKADQSKSVKDGDKSPRDVVIAGLKNAAKANKSGKGRMHFLRTPNSDTAITVVIAKAVKAA